MRNRPIQTRSAAPHVAVKVLRDRVRKTYREGVALPGLATAKFRRESAAYRRFAELGVDFAPRLLGCDEHDLWLETELVAERRTLLGWLETAPSNSFDPVVSQIIGIDKFLYEHRINYLGCSPKDILVSSDFGIHLVDFENTFLDERFQEILYERMFHIRMTQVNNERARDVFFALLANRRDDFHRFLSRKIRNGVLARLGVMRTN